MAIQVLALPALRQPVVESVALVGSVTPNESVEIKSEMDGTIKEIAFSEGQRIQKGDLLIALDETKAQAALTQAESNFLLAKANFERVQKLSSDKLIPQQEYDQASSDYAARQATLDLMRRNLKDARLVAPFSGITGARLVSPGQVISRNATLASVVDLDVVKVEVNMPERYLNQIRIDQEISFGVAAYPGETFTGSVYFISPQLDPATRTALIKARVPNPNAKLRGGMFARLLLTLHLRESALVVPEPALIHNGDAVSVFVVTSNSTVQARPVEVGIRLAGKVEILKGLEVGEQVVVEGVQKLAPGMPVKVAPAERAAAYLTKP